MTANPYQTPTESTVPDRLIRPERGRGMAVAGLVLLFLGSLAASAVVISIAKAFAVLGATGQADPAELAAAISGVMRITLLGMLFTLAGAVFAAISIYGQGNRERWFQVLGTLVFVVQLGTLPLGLPVGIFLLVGIYLKRKEFHPQPDPQESA